MTDPDHSPPAQLALPGTGAAVLVPLPGDLERYPEPTRRAVDAAVAALAGFDTARLSPTLHNFYAGDDDEIRRDRLRRYLLARWDADVLLVGEAAGYQGARLSGIAFTSEHQLTGAAGACKEPSATIVHRTLARLGAETRVLLWNTVPFHPHRPGEPRSNRTPTPAEVAACAPLLDLLGGGRLVVAVGRVAAARTGAAYVRHPAHGGATEFATGLAAALATPARGGPGR